MNYREVELLDGFPLKSLFFSEIAHLLKPKLSEGQGVEMRGEGSRLNISLGVSNIPWKTVVFEVDIFASRNPCYLGMLV